MLASGVKTGFDSAGGGIDLPAGRRAGAEAVEGLAALRKFAGSAFKGGFVLYTGPLAFRFNDSL